MYVLATSQMVTLAKQIQARLVLMVLTFEIQHHDPFQNKITDFTAVFCTACRLHRNNLHLYSWEMYCSRICRRQGRLHCSFRQESLSPCCLSSALTVSIVHPCRHRQRMAFMLLADCQVASSSCISGKCSSPGAIGDGDTCNTGSGKFRCPDIALF